MKALFLDFDDSFTFNLVQELTEAGLEVNVIPWREFTHEFKFDLLVLGPGPGHPDDYREIYPLVEDWMKKGGKVFAVCLGHQILWRLMGHEVRRSAYPLHGQKIQLSLAEQWQKFLSCPPEVWVQRYNSLAVFGESQRGDILTHSESNEIVISRSNNFLSYQFHPESVGTNCRQSFFRAIFVNLL